MSSLTRPWSVLALSTLLCACGQSPVASETNEEVVGLSDSERAEPQGDASAAQDEGVGPDTEVAVSDRVSGPGDTEVVTAEDTSSSEDGFTAWDSEASSPDPNACSCDGPTHCDDQGACVPDICEKGRTTCATIDTLQHCDAAGASATLEPCFPGQVCSGGECVDPICEPNALGGCSGTDWLACNSLGTEWVSYACPLDAPCQTGECRPVEPNVLLLIDTSGSMNWRPNGDPVEPCNVGECEATWTFPICDNPQTPITRLGLVKQALNTVVQSDAAQGVRLALQRFPQRPFEPGSGFFGGSGVPECDGGYWISTDEARITGDPGNQTTSMNGWFGAGLGEVLLYPFAEKTEIDVIAQWFDYKVETVATETYCEMANVCAGGPCVFGNCLTTINPELRGRGPTPLGKSLFYAGEYLRHQVLMEGKSCTSDAQCGSPHYTCEDGVCHDPYGHCRDNIIILFTDGVDTRNVATSDFFNPRVQAKRLHFGLGCADDDECMSGASCVSGVCRAPSELADAEQLVCDAGEMPCTNDNECEDPCGNWGNCPGNCAPTEPLTVSNEGNDHLSDHAGKPVPVRVHVVDASGIEGNNSLIAVYGGGEYFDVNLDNPEELVASVYEILGDTKEATPCAAE